MDSSQPLSRSLDYETIHVHEVYEQIAAHFSTTRYKVCLFHGILNLLEYHIYRIVFRMANPCAFLQGSPGQ